jgi:hypothetical protein
MVEGSAAALLKVMGGHTRVKGTLTLPGQLLASVTLSTMFVVPSLVGVPMSFLFTASHVMPEGRPVGVAKV